MPNDLNANDLDAAEKIIAGVLQDRYPIERYPLGAIPPLSPPKL